MAKKTGCRVGTTTNGMLLGPDQIDLLVDSEIDFIAFSLAGLDASMSAVPGKKPRPKSLGKYQINEGLPSLYAVH